MGKSFKKLTAEERKLNNEKGRFIESLAKKLYQLSGWVVVPMQIVKEENDQFRSVINYEELRKLKNYNTIIDIITEGTTEFNKINEKFRFPDFVCEKNDVFMFVEVKSSDVNVSQMKQRKTLEFLGKKGYKVEILTLPISIEDFVKANLTKKGGFFSL